MNSVGAMQAFDKAYADYFALSRVLRLDLEALLDADFESDTSRRNFLRAVWALIEGYAESMRRISAPVVPLVEVTPTTTQQKLLDDERRLGSCDRVKEGLKLAYSAFGFLGCPTFKEREWSYALASSEKRDAITHPKVVSDLDVSDPVWNDSYAGAIWIVEQLFGFHAQMKDKYFPVES